MTTRAQSRVDSGRRELGARVQNYHVPSADREGDVTPETNTPASILLTITTPPPVTLSVGATYQTTATVYNAVGNVIAGMQPTGWQSSSPTVATVDGNGLVTGVSAGTVSITATLNAITSNALSITVVAALPDTTPASVTISPTTLIVQSGAPQTLSAVVKNAAGAALAVSPTLWVSSDVTKATVSQTGVVTWVSAGTTTVTARYNTIISNSCVVTAAVVVDTTPASVAISPTTMSLVTGAPQTLAAVVKNAAGTALAVSPTSWTSSDPTKATVNSSGVVTWVAAGTTSVTAHYNAITSNACAVTALVDANTVATSVTVSPTTLTLQVSAPQTLNAVIKNSSGVALALSPTSWTSSNTGVATVNGSGVVTWVAQGTTNVAAHYNALDSNNCAVTALANPAVATSVTVSPTSLSLQSGSPQTLTAVIKNSAGTALALSPTSWTSSDTGKATVNSSGVVTWVAAGTTNVAAHYNALDSNNCAVTAVPAADTTPASILIAPSTATIEVGRTQQLTALVKNAAGQTLGGVSPSGWSSATPATCTVSSTGLVTGIAAGGPINVTATLNALTSNACAVTVSASSAGGQDLVTVTEPTPMVTTVASTPSAGSVISVANGGDFQAALNSAVPGDVIELAANAVVSAAGYTLPVKTGGIGGGWITVRGAGSRPAEFTQVTEADAITMQYPKIRSTANNVPVISSHVATSHWRFMGVTIEVDPSVTTMGALIEMGVGGAPDTTTATLPDGVYFDRCVIRGHTTLDCRRAIALNAKSIACFDCCVKEIHSTFDAQASAGWNGPGPFKIHNNLIEASTENISFGGSDPAITGLNPTNIEITHNYIRKPIEWLGGPWLIKNLLELKKGKTVLIEGNVFENSWPQGQSGFCFVLWSVNQQATDSTAETGNVTIRKNVILTTAAGMSMNKDGSNDLPQYPAVAMHHIAINNNVFIGLDSYPINGNGRMFEINNQIEHLSIEHNTGFSPSNPSFIWGGHLPLTNHTVKNNLVGGGQYQLFAGGINGAGAIPVAGASPFTGNLVVLAQGVPPATNDFPNQFAYLGLVGGASAAYDPTVTPAALALEPWSGYHNYGTDGTDPGADIAAVLAATSGVTSRW